MYSIWRPIMLGALAACAIIFQPSESAAQTHKTIGAETTVFGQPKRFSRHLKRPEFSNQQSIERFSLTIPKVISRDNRFVRIEHLAIKYAIVDPEKFKGMFGEGSGAVASANARLTVYLESELRVSIGKIMSDKLHEFDPISLVYPGRHMVSQAIRSWGVVVVEIIDEKSAYRISKMER